METKLNWNTNLDEAIGKGWVLLAGINKADGSKWWEQALNNNGVWENTDCEAFPTVNVELRAWATVEYPF